MFCQKTKNKYVGHKCLTLFFFLPYWNLNESESISKIRIRIRITKIQVIPNPSSEACSIKSRVVLFQRNSQNLICRNDSVLGPQYPSACLLFSESFASHFWQSFRVEVKDCLSASLHLAVYPNTTRDVYLSIPRATPQSALHAVYCYESHAVIGATSLLLLFLFILHSAYFMES